MMRYLKTVDTMLRPFSSVLILLLTALLFCRTATAQGGTLQFNQALMLTESTYPSAGFTVPSGKVWKIESWGGSNSTNFCVAIEYYSGGTWNMLGYMIATGYAGAASTYSMNRNSPVWLPAGAQIRIHDSCSNKFAWVSALEFNVIP